MSNIVIAVDAMGGDNAPLEVIKACVDAVNEKDIKILTVGPEAVIKEELSKYNYDSEKIEIVNADEVINTDESPTQAIRKKKNSSMLIGLRLVKNGQAQAFVSAGNTGALLTGATITIGRLKGIERPALATMLPTANKAKLLLDSGANVDSKASYLLQFARLGSLYMESVMNIKNPAVGLINIGIEKEKGNVLTKEAYDLLECSGLNFMGNVEPRDIPFSEADVLIGDAFVGNTILKFGEGVGIMLFEMLKEELMSTFSSKIGAMLCLKSFKKLKQRFDYAEVGGAPFLGLKSLVVKAHGSSDSKAIKNAVYQCLDFIESDFIVKIKESLQNEQQTADIVK